MKYLIFLFNAFLFFSCQKNSEGSFTQTEASVDYANYEQSSTNAENNQTIALDEDEQTQGEDGATTPSSTNTVQEKKIIKTANLEIEVSDYKKSRERLNSILSEYDAVIQQEQEQNLSYRLQNNLTIRLAPEKLDGFIKSVEADALNVFNKIISATDVTKEFIDMETRLQSKRAVIERYQFLLKQAKNVEEILAVEAQLRQVIEEVESVEGQLKYLKDQVGQSTVHLTMYEKLEQAVYQKRGFFSRLGSSIKDGWAGFLEFLIGVATLWPFWILLLVLLALFRRYRRGRKT